jgi:hypothetical protein
MYLGHKLKKQKLSKFTYICRFICTYVIATVPVITVTVVTVVTVTVVTF